MERQITITTILTFFCVFYRTIFTRAGRHNYADPDYSYTDEEMAAIEAHRKYYRQFVDDLREDRKEKVRVKEHKQFNDDTNIGIKVCVDDQQFMLSAQRVCY